MNLSSMRSVDHNDPIGGLGPRVERAPTPAPAPVVRPDGIVVGADGKLSTALPLPEGHPDAAPTHIGGVPVWPFPTKPEPVIDTTTEEPGAHGFLREPLRVGDRIRLTDAWPENCGELSHGVVHVVHGIHGEQAKFALGGFVVLAQEGITWERVA